MAGPNFLGSGPLQINSSSSSYFINGNVGIGTSSPSQKLHVSGGRVRIDLSAAGIILEGFVSSETNPRMRLQSERIEFGSGGAIPDTVLERAGANLWAIGTDDALQLGQGGGGGSAPATSGALRMYNNAFIDTRNATNTGNFALIGAAGNEILIGGSDGDNGSLLVRAPSLQVRRGAGFTGPVFMGVTGGENPKVQIQHDRIEFGPGGGSSLDIALLRPEQSTIGFTTGGVERMRITSSGAVRVGGQEVINSSGQVLYA